MAESKKDAPKRSFRVTGGKHAGADGVTYHPGEIVHTSEPLTEKFKNKFEEVRHGSEPTRSEHLTIQEQSAAIAEKNPTAPIGQATYRDDEIPQSEVEISRQHDPQGAAGAPTIISEEAAEQAVKDAEKEVEAAQARVKAAKEATKKHAQAEKDRKKAREQAKEEKETPAAPAEAESADREDVTEKFPKAAEADLKVFKVGREYQVVESDDDSKPVNEETLTNQKDVNEFISTFLKD